MTLYRATCYDRRGCDEAEFIFEADGDDKAMAVGLRKLRTVQKGYDPESYATVYNGPRHVGHIKADLSIIRAKPPAILATHEFQRMARILDDMEGLALKPTEVARQARRLRFLIEKLTGPLPPVVVVEGEDA